MDYLKGYLSQENVRNAIQACRDSWAVQGVALDLDEWWLSAWRMAEQINPRNPASVKVDAPFYGPLFDPETSVFQHLSPITELHRDDLKWAPSWWEQWPRRGNITDRTSPVRLRICLYPRYGTAGEISLPNLRDFGVNYIFESRPVPQLAVSRKTLLDPLIGGGSIGVHPKRYGTLGGIVRDGQDHRFGVTCAHVATQGTTVYQPSQHDARVSRVVGVVTHSQLPSSYPANLPITPANQAANSNDVDAALVRIDDTVASALKIDALGPITGLFPNGQIQQWHPALFAGRTSGLQAVEFRAPLAYYNVPDASRTGTACFNNIYQIQWAGGRASGRPPIQQGDSGAWLCVSTASGYQWAGLVVAWDAISGFAVSASAVESWWDALGVKLQPM